MFLAIDIDPNIYLMLYSFSVTINLSIPNVHQKNLLFCHRTQAIVLHHMFLIIIFSLVLLVEIFLYQAYYYDGTSPHHDQDQ